MTEPKLPPKEAYLKELQYLEAMRQHGQDLSELIEKIPEEEQGVIDTVRQLSSVKPNWLLDPEKLKQLRQQDEELYQKVTSYYLPFLEEKAGLK